MGIFEDPAVPTMLEIWAGECWTDGHKNRVITPASSAEEAKNRIANRFGLSPEDVFNVKPHQNGK